MSEAGIVEKEALAGSWARLLSRMVRYGLVGVSGIGVNFLVLRLDWILLHSWPSLAFGAAIEAAIVTNYLGNARFTFASALSWGSFLRYNLVAAGGGGVQDAISSLLVHAHWNYLAANLVGIPVGTLIGFVLSQVWVFRVSAGKRGIAGATSGSPGRPAFLGAGFLRRRPHP